MASPYLSIGAETDHHVLRARLGVSVPNHVSRAELEHQISEAIADAVASCGGELEVLQLGLAAQPEWYVAGPVNRVTGHALY